MAMATLVALVQQENDAGGIGVYFIREQKARKPRTVGRPRREIVLESTPIRQAEIQAQNDNLQLQYAEEVFQH
jgi:hypothetical protein